MKSIIQKTKKCLFDLLFPKFCAGCRREGVFLCGICQTALQSRVLTPACPICSFRNGSGIVCGPCRTKTAISHLIAIFPYREKMIRELVHGFKYHRVRELGPLFGDFLAEYVRMRHISVPRTALVMPIPLHNARMRERGFNQSAEIGKRFAAAMELGYRDDILSRTAYTKSQVACADFRERRRNIAGVFAIQANQAIRHKTVILIDDITTSGATLDEAGSVLKTAGAKTVWGITVAKG